MNDNLSNLEIQYKTLICHSNEKADNLSSRVKEKKDSQLIEEMDRDTYMHIIDTQKHKLALRKKQIDQQKKQLNNYGTMSNSIFDLKQQLNCKISKIKNQNTRYDTEIQRTKEIKTKQNRKLNGVVTQIYYFEELKEKGEQILKNEDSQKNEIEKEKKNKIEEAAMASENRRKNQPLESIMIED